MTPVFADTSFYVAILSPRDSLHAIATEWSKANRNPIVTTEFILTEVANFFTHPDQRGNFIQLMTVLSADPQTDIVQCSSDLFRKGFDVFAARRDKHWSLTDCTSYTVMMERGLTDALTSDHHFEQAGFKTLLTIDDS